jgi:hypothetical protein
VKGTADSLPGISAPAEAMGDWGIHNLIIAPVDVTLLNNLMISLQEAAEPFVDLF